MVTGIVPPSTIRWPRAPGQCTESFYDTATGGEPYYEDDGYGGNDSDSSSSSSSSGVPFFDETRSVNLIKAYREFSWGTFSTSYARGGGVGYDANASLLWNAVARTMSDPEFNFKPSASQCRDRYDVITGNDPESMQRIREDNETAQI
jgi:hypothetical protein